MAKLAVIAGGGALPDLVVAGCRKLGRDFTVVALKGITDPQWVAPYPHQWFRVGQVGGVVRELKKQKVTELVLAGYVQRPALKASWLQFRPDGKGLKLLWRLLSRKMGDDALLRVIAKFFEDEGIRITGADQLVLDALMPAGNLTMAAPNDNDWNDIHYAARLLYVWADLDQGQSIVVQNGLILGVEAAEGTDELIKRCGKYKRDGRGPILVKMKKPNQDRRLDLPTVGLKTIQNAVEAGFSGIAVQAGEALFLQPLPALAKADESKFFIVGFDPE